MLDHGATNAFAVKIATGNARYVGAARCATKVVAGRSRGRATLGSNEPRQLLRHDVVDYFAADIGQAEIATLEAISQSRVVEAQQIQNRGLQIMRMDRLFDGGPAEFVGGAVGNATFEPAAGHEHRIRKRTMIAP